MPSGSWYLPDFRVESNGLKAWVEIKGGIYDNGLTAEMSFNGALKTMEFAQCVSKRGGVTILLGDIPSQIDDSVITPHRRNLHQYIYDSETDGFVKSCIVQIEEYDALENSCSIYAEVMSASDDLFSDGCYVLDMQKDKVGLNKYIRTHWPHNAYDAARCARFEHGESPR